MKSTILEVGLGLIAEAPELLSKLDMPNINFPTMGGEIFWNDLATNKGWRLQQNTVFKNCRILDPDDVRRAWGGHDAMMKFFNELVELKEKYR